MLRKLIRYNANSYLAGSLANQLRKQRMSIFEGFFIECFEEQIKKGRRINIIDLGGDYRFWESMNFKYIDLVDITLINIIKKDIPCEITNFNSLEGDATNLCGIRDMEFDLAFSNSCIEHVGGKNEWIKMAREIKRVAPHFFLQTPNYFFPIEPHFLFPLFQFLPTFLRAFLINRFQLGFWPKGESYNESVKIANEIKLLRKKDLELLFPDSIIIDERLLGLKKSFMVHDKISKE